jgi:nitrogen fixation protein NifU and related proteins
VSADTVVQLFNNPQTQGALPDADAVGQEGVPGEGPFMTVYLKLDRGSVREARFETYACPYAVACGAWVTRWVVGRTTEQALLLEASDLSAILGGLPLGKEHCASLAVGALRVALMG